MVLKVNIRNTRSQSRQTEVTEEKVIVDGLRTLRNGQRVDPELRQQG